MAVQLLACYSPAKQYLVCWKKWLEISYVYVCAPSKILVLAKTSNIVVDCTNCDHTLNQDIQLCHRCYSPMRCQWSWVYLPSILPVPSWCSASSWSLLNLRITCFCWRWPHVDSLKITVHENTWIGERLHILSAEASALVMWRTSSCKDLRDYLRESTEQGHRQDTTRAAKYTFLPFISLAVYLFTH